MKKFILILVSMVMVLMMGLLGVIVWLEWPRPKPEKVWQSHSIQFPKVRHTKQADGERAVAKYGGAKSWGELLAVCGWKTWCGNPRQLADSEGYSFCVEFPDFMDVEQATLNDLCMTYGGVKLIANRYYDEARMSVQEKYEALKCGAVTSSVGDDYFLLAGHIGADHRFFEKDFKIGRHWYYLRVEFPVELTKEVEPLLQYVLHYRDASKISSR